MEKFRPPHGDLFRKGTTEDLRRSIQESIKSDINVLEDDYILNVDESEYINYIVEKHKIECPIIHYNDEFLDPRKVMTETHYLSGYYTQESLIERNVYRLYIPYSGETEMLKFCPTTFYLSEWQNISIGTKELYVDILDADNRPETIRQDIDSYNDTMAKMMGFLQNDINSINNQMLIYARETFLSKKEKVKSSQNLIASIGLPIKGNDSQSSTYSVPTVHKKYKQPEAGLNLTNPQHLSPIMDDKIYRDLLTSIQDYGQSLERIPETYKDKDEESIRGLFLANLSSSFESQSSTGESFNNTGKTDIMVRHGNEILFIAECKIWKGPAALLKAITQLLSYLTWRDSKTSLLLFVKNGQMSKVLESVKKTIPNHPSYIRSENQDKDTWLNYTFRMDGDDNKMVKMAVQLFDFKED